MKKFYPSSITLVATVIVAVLSLPVQAQEITGASIAAPTTITNNTVVTDTTQAANQYGLIDADGGTFNVPSITAGVDDGTARITFISIIDSAGGGDIVTIDNDVTVTTGATNPDTLFFVGGSSNLGASDLLSTGIHFNGNIDAGNGKVIFSSINATNPDSYTFSGTSYNLGSGGLISFSAANDTLTFDGASAQSFSGDLNGAAGGTGDIIVTNASGVTFNGKLTDIDTLTIAGSGTDSSATLTKQTTIINGITLGDGAGSDTNTLTLDTSGGDFTFDAAISGTAGDTDNIVITGGNSLTADTNNYDYDIDNLTVDGAGTVAVLWANTTHNISDTVTIDNDATLQLKGDLSAGNGIVNSGTLHLETGGAASVDVTGDISGSGMIDVDEDSTLTGNVTASSVDVASDKTLTISGAGKTYNVGSTTLNSTVSFPSEIVFDQSNIVGDIVSNSDTQGIVTFTDAAVTQTITGDIGTASKRLYQLQTKDDGGALANTVQTTGNIYAAGIILGANDTLQFTGNTPQTVNAGVAYGTLTVGNGTSASDVTFLQQIGGSSGLNVMSNATATLALAYQTNSISSVSVDGTLNANSIFVNTGDFSVGGTMNVNNTFTNTGDFSVDGTMNVNNTFTNNGNLSVDGILNVKKGVSASFADIATGSSQGSIVLAVDIDGTSGKLIDTGASLDFSKLDGSKSGAAKLSLSVGSGVMTLGQEFLIIDADASVTNFTNGTLIDDNSLLYDFTLYDGATATLGVDDSDIVAKAGLTDLEAAVSAPANATVLETFTLSEISRGIAGGALCLAGFEYSFRCTSIFLITSRS